MNQLDIALWPNVAIPAGAQLYFASDELAINYYGQQPPAQAEKHRALETVGKLLKLQYPQLRVLALQRNTLDTGWLLLCAPAATGG